MSSYQPAGYWEELLAGEFDASSVGYPALAQAINLAMYRSITGSVERALREEGVRTAGTRVLDVGSGTGIWIDFWRRHGALQITGIDLTSASVQALQRRWPEHEFAQLDIGQADVALPRGIDLVSAMSVLLHIVDEQRFRAAVANLAAALRPGGWLLLVEPVVVHRWWGPPFGEQDNSRARALATYEEAFASAGLELRSLRAATVLLANVVDTRSRLTFEALNAYWGLLTRYVGDREVLGAAAARLLGVADRLALGLARSGPSAKVLVARRCA